MSGFPFQTLMVQGTTSDAGKSTIVAALCRLLKQRGQFFSTRWAPKTLATLHPSAVLRGQDDAEQARLYAMLLADLRLIATA